MMTRRSLAAAALCAFAAPTALPAGPKPAADIVQTAAAGDFRTLVTCLVAADLVGALKADGPFVVFAPTDAAFARLPKGTVEALLKPENKEKLRAVLSYHVVPKRAELNYEAARKGGSLLATLAGADLTIRRAGADVLVNDAKVVARNVACRNGSVQVIDAVLLPPEGADRAAAAGDAIPAVAAKTGTFGTLLAALKAADLDEALSGPGPFTVFAPTDAAFAKLPEGAVAKLLQPENRKQLVALLKYHVVPAAVSAKAAVAAGEAKTLAGGRVRAEIRDGRLYVNDSAVVKSDVPAGNGVIHAIDTVLTPRH